MPVFNNILAGAAGQTSGGDGEFKIERSLRFDLSSSSKLSRTPSSASNRRTWTLSFWIKRGKLYDEQMIFSAAENSTNRVHVYIASDDRLAIYNPSWYYTTDHRLRDSSGWTHLVIACDTTQSTDTDRVKIYKNGVLIDSFVNQVHPSQNLETTVNSAVLHQFSGRGYNTNDHFDGYLAECHMVDGQQLLPTAFGEFDADTGVWNPIEYTGEHNAPATGSNPTSTSNVAPSGGYGNTIPSAALLFSIGGPTSATSHIRQDGGGIEWSPAITLSGSDVAGVSCSYLNNASTSFDVEFKIDGSWVTAQSNAQNVIGTSTAGVLITHATTGSWTGVRVTGGSNVSVSGILGIYKNGSKLHNGASNGFHLDFSNASSNAALGYDAAGSNNWTVDNLSATHDPTETEVTAAWAGYVGSWATTDTWNGLSAATGFGDNPGTKGYSSTTETWAGSKTIASGDFGASIRGGNGWAIRYPSSVTVTINPAAQGSLTDVVVCPDETTSIANGTSVTSFPATVTGQVFWYRYTGAGYPAVDALGTITNPGGVGSSMLDSPMDYVSGTNVGGNYATLNPVATVSGLTLSNGNLEATGNAVQGCSLSTIFPSSGKYYAEFTLDTYHADTAVGVVSTDVDFNQDWVGEQAYTVGYLADGRLFQNSSSTNIGAYAAGDTIGIAFDVDTGKIWFSKNGTFINSGNPGAGTGELSTITGGKPLGIAFRGVGAGAGSFNFGQLPYSISSVPTGFESICTQNLSDPTIEDPSSEFNVVLYSSDGSARTISGLNSSPDLIWSKRRSAAGRAVISDIVRGTNKELYPNLTDAQRTSTDGLTAFNSDGYTIGNDSGQYGWQANNNTFVNWCWDAGSTNTSVSAGSLNSSVYETSQTWSSNITTTGNSGSWSTSSGFAVTNAFNGDDSNYAHANPDGSSTCVVTLSISPAISCNSSVTFLGGVTSSGNGTISINGGTATAFTTSATNPTADNTVTVPFSGNISSIVITKTSTGGNGVLIYGFKIDGKRLIDNGTTVTDVPAVASTHRANPTAGFSIVKVDNPNTTESRAHGLGKKPDFIICKSLASADSWHTYHSSLGYTYYLNLNSTGAATSSDQFGSQEPDANLFYVKSATGSGANKSGGMVYYIWSGIDGFSSFGSYEGTGSNEPAFVFTNFRPALVVCKNVDASQPWQVYDSARGEYNVIDEGLKWDDTSAEYSGTARIDFLSNGFKIRATGGAEPNVSGQTYVYCAWAENPFKYSRAA